MQRAGDSEAPVSQPFRLILVWHIRGKTNNLAGGRAAAVAWQHDSHIQDPAGSGCCVTGVPDRLGQTIRQISFSLVMETPSP